ncbi:DUF3168 domain-containing protein [Epibacterium sp. SM1969]|uniref:DUF3168 domain-containing protein n=1 Tax=Tritonibacter aquimaris TaxID=2663379 RepID=A0A844AWV5_9RHOB|nr:DUF3168 domain-containing protein [Tritonibacter aquimaris]MQY41656.1 DUF3168 domain-containing protein [Tritonibacter aquimaris]
MSYATSAALQMAIYDALQSDSAVSSVLSGHIYDALPSGSLPAIYALIGTEEARDRSDKTHSATLYLVTIRVISESAGFVGAKQAAGAICDAILGSNMVMTRGAISGCWFDRAYARSLKSGGREVSLRFRFHVDDRAITTV